MAEKLNKNRVRDIRLMAGVLLGIVLFTEPMEPGLTWPHEISEFAGFALVALCVMGRIYSTLFIGGIKNHKLMTEGPFSVVRNPLYLFSLIGVVGIGLMSARLSILMLLLGACYIIFSRMITREEHFLQEKFGKEYTLYCHTTPQLWPNLKLYKTPKIIEIHPQYVLNAMKDAILWFMPYFVFELIEWLHTVDILPVIITLP